MEYIHVKTRVMHPPQDDLYEVLDASLTDVHDGDVVLVTSKIVAIHQGRCVPIDGTDKDKLVDEEADYRIDRSYFKYPITIKYNTFLAAAGIDASNSGEYYALLPEDPFGAAKEIWEYLRKKHKVENLGVIITDSHHIPFRTGAMGISISFWGIEPVDFHQGKPDLFGRPIEASSTNMVDTIAAGGAIVSGEVDECHPVVIARNVPNLVFTDKDVRHKLLVPPHNDMYKVLFEDFLPPRKDGDQTVTAYLGLGANLDSEFGTPPQTLEKAVEAIKDAGVTVQKVSPMYKTAPVPVSDDPWYHNQVIEVETSLTPHNLLKLLNTIEADFGRVRTVKNAPRIIALDILTYGYEWIHDDQLSVPHPRMKERAFVLYPLRDIAPDFRHPMTDVHIDATIGQLPEQKIEKIV